jgi:hypothetical protein
VISLKEVTLVCFDTRNLEAAINSMARSMSHINFSESIFFTNQELCSKELVSYTKDLGIRAVFVNDVKTITQYSLFILEKLDSYINTNFCLVTQWDSWVINIKSWDMDFLNYDYIGAIWPDYMENKVGIGGFSLRSKRLLKSTREILETNSDFSIPLIEDDFICREKRKIFEEKYQLKFPDVELANKFSVERNGIPIESFGFHGMFNFNFVLSEDNELRKLINTLSSDCFLDVASYDLTKSLIIDKRFNIAKLVILKRFKVIGFSTKNIRLICLLLLGIL